MPVPDTFSDKRSGDIHHRRFNEFNVRMRFEFGRLRVRTRINVKAIIAENSFMVFPFYEIDEVVFAQDDPEFLVGMFFAQVDEGMNGVARSRQMKLDVRRFDLDVVIDGCAHHVIAVKFVEQSSGRFEWVLRRHHQPDFLEIGGLGHDTGNDQVPDMDGIKRAKEETDFQGFEIVERGTNITF